LSDDVPKRVLPDGRTLHLLRYLYNWRVAISAPGDDFGYEDEWCYKDPVVAATMWADWDGSGDDGPPGWNKHPLTGRWRGDGTPASEVDRDSLDYGK
jgi:hypothetical protein